MRILIADDHPVFRRGLRLVLEPRYEVVAEAREGAEAVQKTLALKPDIVVIDINMPGMDGLEATRRIKAERPSTSVVVISALDTEQQVFDAIKAGANGYVSKQEAAQSIIQAVETVADGKAYLPPGVAKIVIDRISSSLTKGGDLVGPSSSALTERELTVLQLLAAGQRNKEIAEALCISERTVGNHIGNIYRKLHINDRAHAIVYAVKKGLITI